MEHIELLVPHSMLLPEEDSFVGRELDTEQLTWYFIVINCDVVARAPCE